MKKICLQCRKGFRAYRAKMKFCSRACGVLGRKGITRKASATNNAQCGYCGKTLYRKPSNLKRNKIVYCSLTCCSMHRKSRFLGSANPNYRNAGHRRCEGCGMAYKSLVVNRRFCGIKCSQRLQHNEYLTNLRRGLEAEKRCMAELKSQGYSVFLSAASRGPYDVIALNENHALLISVKRTKSYYRRSLPIARRALLKAIMPMNGHFRKQLWCFVEGYGWVITEM